VKNALLIGIKDSHSSKAAVDFIVDLDICPERVGITLLHVFRKPTAGEELMGEKFMQAQPTKIQTLLAETKERLVEKGCPPDKVTTKMTAEAYPTVADGIIDQFRRGDYTMVVIGRKKMSKAEEFVKGDISMKLIRALTGAAVLVVTTH
jgi:nucleotide-binding universal stress UspA family protein